MRYLTGGLWERPPRKNCPSVFSSETLTLLEATTGNAEAASAQERCRPSGAERQTTPVLEDVTELLIIPHAAWTPSTSRFSVLWNPTFPHNLSLPDSGRPSRAARGTLNDPAVGGPPFWAPGRAAPLGLWLCGAGSRKPCEMTLSGILCSLPGNSQRSGEHLLHQPGFLSADPLATHSQ